MGGVTTSPCEPASRLSPSTSRDPRAFRDALGRYPTGVVLVTAMTPDGPAGLAANSFTSVSLDPPLVSFCAAHSSTSWPRVRPVGGFAISTLGAHHEDVCRLFARSGADKFAEHDWALSPAGHPVLADAMGWFDATIEWVRPAGDHDVVVARAERWSEPRRGEPLVFFGGRYHSLPGGGQ